MFPFILKTKKKILYIFVSCGVGLPKLMDAIDPEAVEEANILVRRAEGDARRLRLETEDEIEKKLQRVEVLLEDIMTQVQTARDELHQARPRPPEVPI